MASSASASTSASAGGRRSHSSWLLSPSSWRPTWQQTSLLVQHFPLLLSCSNASLPADPEGYHLTQLAHLTFDVEVGGGGGDSAGQMARHVAHYLVARLKQHGTSLGRIKTLKTLGHLTHNGSRAFRQQLRLLDDVLRAAAAGAGGAGANAAVEMAAIRGASGIRIDDAEVRRLARELREYLFSSELMQRDDDDCVAEVHPREQNQMRGMGSSGQGGKYDGFGSAGKAKVTLGSNLMNLLEKAISLGHDDREEVLKMCLENSTGDYEPVKLDFSSLSLEGVGRVDEQGRQQSGSEDAKKAWDASASAPASSSSAGLQNALGHVPGRAGGGWASEDEEDEDKEKSTNVEQITQEVLTRKQEATSVTVVKNEELANLIFSYCKIEGSPTRAELRNTFRSIWCSANLSSLDSLLRLLSEHLKPDSPTSCILRALLLVEESIHSTQFTLKPSLLITPTLTSLCKHQDARVATKAEKNMLVCNQLLNTAG